MEALLELEIKTSAAPIIPVSVAPVPIAPIAVVASIENIIAGIPASTPPEYLTAYITIKTILNTSNNYKRVSELSGIGRQHLSRVFRRLSVLSTRSALILSKALGVSVGALLWYLESVPPQPNRNGVKQVSRRKLDEASVARIREEYGDGKQGVTLARLAEIYGVSAQTISNAVKGICYVVESGS